MKKTTINLLCILIIVILSGSIIVPGVYLTQAVAKGFNNNADQESVYTPIRVTYNASSEHYFRPNGSIESADGKSYPFASRSGIVMVPDNKMPAWYDGMTIGCFCIEIVLFVLLVVELIQFIININRNRVFDRRNVKRLRRFGFYLIMIAILQCIIGLSDATVVNSLHLQDSKLELVANWNFPWGNLLIGLIAMLMSQIWSMGLEMKQEQELTI